MDSNVYCMCRMSFVEHRKPNKAYTRVELKRDSRRTLSSIRKTIGKNRYRRDLNMVHVTL